MGFSLMQVQLSFLLYPKLIQLLDFDYTQSFALLVCLFSFYYSSSFVIKAALAIFLAFLNTKTSLIIMKNKASNKPIIDITIKTICGIKLESVIVVVGGRLISFGMKMKMIIKITGTITPTIEQIYGFDELLHNRHHKTLNTIAMMMMNVPTPIPKILPLEFWQFIQENRLIIIANCFIFSD